MQHIISLHTNLPNPAAAHLRAALGRILSARGIPLAADGDRATYRITLTLDPTLTSDRFLITPKADGAAIRAASICAAFAALGKLLRMSAFDGAGGFTPSVTPVDFTPKSPVRGMYFATHFHNFYHNAPLEEVFAVIDDLALRGANSLLVWFDMHHYSSMQDPSAQAHAARLRAILTHANEVGMGGALTMLSNEAFSTSPAHLRAEWEAQNGYFARPDSHYHVEICPNREGGIAEILRQRREMLEAFCDLKIDYVVYWPYDQGGCTCEKCTPWGANGFLKLLPHFQNLVREMMPDTRVIVSTWYFDRFIAGEWDAFLPQLGGESFAEVPYLMSFFFRGEVPESVQKYADTPAAIPQISFPEISMYSCVPWGGYGASVLTNFLETTHQKTATLYRGGYPYSEGIFEDANKFIQLGLFSGDFAHAADALHAYVRFTFCCADETICEELFEAIRRTETALARTRTRTEEGIRVTIEDTTDIDFVYETLQKYNATLPKSVTQAPAFRLFYLRSIIDREIVRNDGYANRSAAAQAAMREINVIYHADDQTLHCVKAPVGL